MFLVDEKKYGANLAFRSLRLRIFPDLALMHLSKYIFYLARLEMS